MFDHSVKLPNISVISLKMLYFLHMYNCVLSDLGFEQTGTHTLISPVGVPGVGHQPVIVSVLSSPPQDLDSMTS